MESILWDSCYSCKWPYHGGKALNSLIFQASSRLVSESFETSYHAKKLVSLARHNIMINDVIFSPNVIKCHEISSNVSIQRGSGWNTGCSAQNRNLSACIPTSSMQILIVKDWERFLIWALQPVLQPASLSRESMSWDSFPIVSGFSTKEKHFMGLLYYCKRLKHKGKEFHGIPFTIVGGFGTKGKHFIRFLLPLGLLFPL